MCREFSIFFGAYEVWKALGLCIMVARPGGGGGEAYRTECQRHVKDADICEQHDILSQSGRDSGLRDGSPRKFLKLGV